MTSKLVDNFTILFRRTVGPLLAGWLVLAVADLVLMITVVAAVFGVAYGGGGTENLAALITGGVIGALLIGTVALVVNALRVALYKPMKLVMTHGRDAVPSLGEVFRLVRPQVVPVLAVSLAVGLICILGLVAFVIPGLIAAFFLMMAPYYAATRSGISVSEALRLSYRTVKEYRWSVAGALLFLGIAGVAVSTLSNGLSMTISNLLAVDGMMLRFMVSSIMQAALGIVVWIGMGAFFITIDEEFSAE